MIGGCEESRGDASNLTILAANTSERSRREVGVYSTKHRGGAAAHPNQYRQVVNKDRMLRPKAKSNLFIAVQLIRGFACN